jgi:hypothetical protein
MSGFERSGNSAWTEDAGSPFPTDFTSDEVELVAELAELFAPEQEILPPLYVQTLMDDERQRALEPEYAQKVTYRVFRRLSLPRTPLFAHQRRALSWRDLTEPLSRVTRSVATAVVATALAMLISVVLVSPSFAAGLRILLGQTGVQQVQSYPQHVRQNPHSSTSSGGEQMLQFDPNMPISWVGLSNDGYVYRGVRLLPPTDWSRGPIVDLQYELTGPHVGSGLLDIREFQVNDQTAAVLQVVQVGSVTQVQVGDSPAAYVNGTWMGPHRVWQPGVRSELIFEQNGVVFWIVGDQRDGMGQDQLVQIASALAPTSPRALELTKFGVQFVGRSLEVSFEEPIGTELLEVLKAGTSPDGGTGAFVEMAPAPGGVS